ncbi:MAG TPA: 50S ribosomal protein L4 [Sumerlaeia bacterium]|nr:50S ribosomal protein L4 [Sumerlaeia bacterium]
MATVAVLNTEGSEVSRLDLAPAVFEAKVNTNCVRAAVSRQLARRRQGCASTKNRARVRGGGAKPWRQKGTGRARSGSRRSPLWRGGGTVFGPTPRRYGGGINRRVARSAIRSCLTSLARDKDLIVLDAIDFPEPKTRLAITMLGNLKAEAGRVLILTEKTDANLALSARNLPFVDVINCDNINTYDLTTHDVLIATAAAVKRLEEIYS